MPISVPDLTRNKRTIPIEIDGQTGEVTYRPGAMTPEIEGLLSNSPDPAQAVVEVTSELLEAWDVLDENGEVYPTDSETLATLPSSLVSAVFRAINDDMAELREERKNFAASSRLAGNKGKRRNGSSFSGRQNS